MPGIKLSTGIEVDSCSNRILVGGDYVPHFRTNQLLGEKVQRLIDVADLLTINLEAPIDTGRTETTKYGPTLGIRQELLKPLDKIGVDTVQLANNHIMDYGISGLKTTLNWCDSHDIETIGAGLTRSSALEPLVTNVGKTKIALLNAGDREFGTAGTDSSGYAWLHDPTFRDAIDRANRSADVLIVLLHGGIEYEPIPEAQRRSYYQTIAEWGADAIIGHHPHVPKGWEIHNGTPICYSIGHFLFDFDPKYRKPKTEWGMLAELRVDNGDLKDVYLYPIKQHEQSPRLRPLTASDEKRQYIRDASSLLTNREYLGVWQELAVRRYETYYRPRLERSLLQQLQYDVDEHQRWLQNILQCESHRWCLHTAAETIGGTRSDQRSDRTTERLERLQKHTRQSRKEQIRQRIAYYLW